MKDIYGNNIIGNFQLNNQFIGKIVSLEQWEEFHIAKIYIKELMPSTDYGKKTIEETIYNSNIKNNKYSNEIISIKIDNGINCRQAVINNQLVKPEIGDEVIVTFIDGDIKKAVFYNITYNYDNDIEIVNKNNKDEDYDIRTIKSKSAKLRRSRCKCIKYGRTKNLGQRRNM